MQYVSNPDQAERCAVAQVRAKTGDVLVYAEFKDVWLATNSQPESCNGLGRMMLSSPLMTAQDRQQRLYAQLRAGQSGLAIATAQTIGVNLSLTQLNQIQANPLNYLWSAPKNNVEDYAYLVYALGRAADTDLTSALQSVPKLVQGVPADVPKNIFIVLSVISAETDRYEKIILIVKYCKILMQAMVCHSVQKKQKFMHDKPFDLGLGKV